MTNAMKTWTKKR